VDHDNNPLPGAAPPPPPILPGPQFNSQMHWYDYQPPENHYQAFNPQFTGPEALSLFGVALMGAAATAFVLAPK
jgi:hypothetical protein